MTTLYLIDNPSALPLDQDVSWQSELADAVAQDPLAHQVMLCGFTGAQNVTLRRWLTRAGLPEGHVLSVLPETEAQLHDCAPELLDAAVESAIIGLAPERCIVYGHAGQVARFGDPFRTASPSACQPGQRRPEDPASGSAVAVNRALPTLAFVSPLPPQPTGIANYSAELIPYLAKHYTITLVVDQPEVDERLAKRFAVLNPSDFAKRSAEFEHVVYQVGNSLYHAYQFALLRHYPGVAVLHDYYLFDAIWWLQESQLWPDAVRQLLYQDHGYPALVALDHPEPDASAEAVARGPEQYPVNGLVTRHATGLIYHSRFAARLAERWRSGHGMPGSVIPHLRELPASVDRGAARHRLALDEAVQVIASFGGISPKKLTHRLVDAFLDSALASRGNIRLVLVGAQHGGEYGRRLARRIARHPAGESVIITGYVDRERYTDWLAAADIAVQLRSASRGETSGAIFDAMAYGLPLVVNAHGSSVELPEDTVVMLADDVESEALEAALTTLLATSERRQALAEAGRAYVRERLSPTKVAEQYRQALDMAARDAPRLHRERHFDRLAECRALRQCLEAGGAPAHTITRALVELDTSEPPAPPRLLFDVSTIAWHDLKTGIERVTRRLADHLLRHPPAGWRVELIRWGGDDFYLARGFASEQLGLTAPPGPDMPVEARAGDVYLSVEWAPPLLEQAGDALWRMRARGVRCYFTVHDLLPFTLPACFPKEVPGTMRRWFTAIAKLADGILCVSAQVAGDVQRQLDTTADTHRPWVSHFHLGADFGDRQGSATGLKRKERALLERVAELDGATLLMVGTLEPRKGHAQVLDALELLWREGLALNLVIVGKQGWEVAELARRLTRHPQNRRRLFWIQGASDTLLERLYAEGDCLVAASLGEGFGLPLIEAAHHDIAILARDIPVFREVAGACARYFEAETPRQLADALHHWHQDWQRGAVRRAGGLAYQSWSQSAEQWLGRILADLPQAGERQC